MLSSWRAGLAPLVIALGVTAGAAIGCRSAPQDAPPSPAGAGDRAVEDLAAGANVPSRTSTETLPPGRLRAAPRVAIAARPETTETGLLRLRLEERRDGVVFVPERASVGAPAPLLLMLHGAGGDGRGALSIVREAAARSGTIVIAPDSRGASWDVIVDDAYGADVTFIDRALEQTFSRYRIDPARVAVGGFSDGASYAISLGIMNGELFRSVLAFSPGFSAPAHRHGRPRFFLSHGTADAVLPIDRCSRRLAPGLQRAGYQVSYREFEGPHTVPTRMVDEAFAFFLGGTP